VVFYFYMSSKCGIVRNDAVVSDDTVVSNVGVTEKEIIITDSGRSVWHSGTVNGAVLTEGITVADFQIGRLTAVFEILCELTDSGEGEEEIIVPDFTMPINDHMGSQCAVLSDADVVSDDAVRTNGGIITNGGGV